MSSADDGHIVLPLWLHAYVQDLQIKFGEKPRCSTRFDPNWESNAGGCAPQREASPSRYARVCRRSRFDPTGCGKYKRRLLVPKILPILISPFAAAVHRRRWSSPCGKPSVSTSLKRASALPQSSSCTGTRGGSQVPTHPRLAQRHRPVPVLSEPSTDRPPFPSRSGGDLSR